MALTRQERATTLGEDIDRLFLELFKAKSPYEIRKREFLKLEKRWLQKARTPAQRLAVQRTIAKTLLTEAFGFDMLWKEFGRWLRQLQQLGFRDLGMRVHVACLYLQSLHLFPRQAREAWDMVDEAERRVRCLRCERPLRHEYLASLSHAKNAARVPRPTDP